MFFFDYGEDSDIYYKLYGRYYVAKSQAVVMAHVFESVLRMHPKEVPLALAALEKCLSETDYSSLNLSEWGDIKKTGFHNIPPGFRTTRSITIKGKTLCVGTSHNYEAKIKYIRHLLMLCGESETVLHFASGSVENAERVDAYYKRPVKNKKIRYRLFGQYSEANQSDFMADVFKEAFRRKPESIEWALDNLDCILWEDDLDRMSSRVSTVFRTQRNIQINGMKLCVGTGYGFMDKLRRIDKYIEAAGFAEQVYEVLSETDNIVTQSYIPSLRPMQQAAVDAVLEAVKTNPEQHKIGIVSIKAGHGQTAVLIETISELRKQYPKGWAYLIVTDRTDIEEQVEKQLERLLQQQIGEHSWAFRVQDAAAENWTADSVFVCALQKLAVLDQDFIVDKPIFISLFGVSQVKCGQQLALLERIFKNARYLAFVNHISDELMLTETFGPVLYSDIYKGDWQESTFVPVFLECKQRIDSLIPIIREHFKEKNLKKSIVVCATTDEARKYAQSLKTYYDEEVYLITADTANWKDAVLQFKQATNGIAVFVNLWTGLDIPDLECIFVTYKISNEIELMQLAARVARHHAGKRSGHMMLLGTSEEELANWDLPLFNSGEPADLTLRLSSSIVYKSLVAGIKNAVQCGKYEEAYYILAQLKQVDEGSYSYFLNDLRFLFISENDLDENRLHWEEHKEIVAYRAAVWCVMSGQAETVQTVVNADEAEETIIEEEGAAVVRRRTGHAQEIGAKLEQNMVRLLAELLLTDGSEIIMEDFRRQSSGFQFGFDLRCSYRDFAGQRCTCVFECKDVDVISAGEFTRKITEARMAGRTIHQWIVASPSGRISNQLDAFMPQLKQEVREGRWKPIQNLQLWTSDQMVEELFGLVPEIHDLYFPAGNENPRDWSVEKRQMVLRKWRDKVKPAILLPAVWERYINDPSNLLLMQENKEQYESIYGSHVALRCVDEAELPVSGTAEKAILDWLERPVVTLDQSVPDTLFVLGEFGDGKSFLTYSLSRRLVELFKKSPEHYHLPVRILLSELQPGVSAQDFLRLRLQQFEANLQEWAEVIKRYKIVVILDGFDEMSASMDLQSVEANAVRLCETVSLFHNAKLIITSRVPVFNLVKEKLMSYFSSAKTFRLLPVSIKEKMECLTDFAKEYDCEDFLQRLHAMHDVKGLTSKPLFLDMMKTIMLEGDIEVTDSLSIYNAFVKGTMGRKLRDPFWRNDFLMNKEEAWQAVFSLLEKFALLMTEHYNEGATLDKLLSYQSSSDESFARLIWNSLTSPTEEDEQDAENRITSRTLLKEGTNGHTFCHRSMQEYFTARGLCAMLLSKPEEAKDYIGYTDLSYETMQFLAKLLRKLDGNAAGQIQRSLTEMILLDKREPEGQTQSSPSGSTALNLYYAAWNQLPEIDWRSLMLDNVDLTGADLSGRDFTGTSLRYANLDNVCLVHTNLSDCDLTGVRLEETKEIRDIYPADEDQAYVYVLYGDGVLRKWDFFNAKHRAIEVGSRNFQNIAVLDHGIILYSKEQLSFGSVGSAGFLFQGGIGNLEDSYLFDVDENNLLLNKGGFLALYSLADHCCLFDGYPVNHSSAAILLKEDTALVYRDGNGARIVYSSQNKYVETAITGIADLPELTSLAAISVESDERYLICCGYRSGVLHLYSLDITGSVRSLEAELLASAELGSHVVNVAFQSLYTIVYSGLDGVLHIVDISRDGNLVESARCELTIQCKGCIVDGLKPREQREKLLKYMSEILIC